MTKSFDIDNYDDLEDLFRLYQEARDWVDEEIPRGDLQANYALINLRTWGLAHDFMFAMAKVLDDRPFDSDMSLYRIPDDE